MLTKNSFQGLPFYFNLFQKTEKVLSKPDLSSGIVFFDTFRTLKHVYIVKLKIIIRYVLRGNFREFLENLYFLVLHCFCCTMSLVIWKMLYWQWNMRVRPKMNFHKWWWLSIIDFSAINFFFSTSAWWHSQQVNGVCNNLMGMTFALKGSKKQRETGKLQLKSWGQLFG